jgi:hypothetical protein
MTLATRRARLALVLFSRAFAAGFCLFDIGREFGQ